MNQEANFNMDNLLDGTLDDLADVPEFRTFPQGTYRISLGIEQKKVNEHPTFEVKMKCLETVELVDASEAPVENGAECNVLFMMDNEIGQGQFKELLKVAAEHFGPKSNRELIEDLKGAECLVVLTHRKNKNDPDKKYVKIHELQIV